MGLAGTHPCDITTKAHGRPSNISFNKVQRRTRTAMSYPPPNPDDGSAHDNTDASYTPTSAVPVEIELDQIRRYEDFSTVDWIQYSLRERNPKTYMSKPGSVLDRLDNLEGFPGAVWRGLRRAFREGESYVVLTLVGATIGVISALMSILTGWLADIRLGHCSNGWYLGRKFCCLEIAEDGGCDEWHDWGVIPFPWISYILFAALFAWTAAYMVRSYAPYAAGSGISEIKCIIGGFIMKGYLGLETLVIKSMTLPLSIGSGLAVGKEGPSVHVASCVGNVIGRLFPRYKASHTKMRELLTASCAAGVAVAFGSPIGGVLFSIEEMNQTFSVRTMWRSFVCALVAVFFLSSMDPFRTGKLVLFQVSYDRDWHYFEIPAYILLGIFGGFYGTLVSKFNIQMAAFRRKHLANRGVAEAVTLAVLTALFSYLNRFLRIDMTEMMSILFRECEGGGDHDGLCQASSQWSMVWSLLIATVLRVVFIIVSYGCKVPAGIFVPSMAVGATFGRAVGIIMKAIEQSYPNAPWFVGACKPDMPCITPGTYAFLGAGAALSGITGLTVTVVVIMFELTGALTYILPTMIVILVTKSVSDQIGKGGIADQMIRFNGYPFLEKDDAESGDKGFNEPIAHIMRKDLVVIPSTGLPLSELQRLVQGSSFQGFPVVASPTDSTIIGFIPKTELRFALDRARRSYQLSPEALCTFSERGESGSGNSDRVDFGHFVDETPLTVSPKMPLEIVLQLFRRMGPRVILVQSEGQLQGLVTIKDVLRHEATEKHREQAELAHGGEGGWAEWSPLETQGPVLEHALETGLNWAQTRGVGVVNDVIARVRSGRPGSASSFSAAAGSRAGTGMGEYNQDYSFAIGEEEEANDRGSHTSLTSRGSHRD